MKKRISLVLAVLMAVSVLAGCGNTGKEESKASSSSQSSAAASSQSSAAASSQSSAAASSEANEGITFPLAETAEYTAMTILWKNEYLLSDNVTWKKYQEDTNVKIDLKQEFLRAEGSEKGKLVMAGGDYPDFVYKSTFLGNALINEYGADGVFIPLEDLIREYAPNLTKWMDEQFGWQEATAPDGHVYGIPAFMPPEEYGVSNGVWWINQKWMDKLNLEMPTNYEEFYNVLKAFKTQDPNGNGQADEIPIIAHGFGPLRQLINYLGTEHGVHRQTQYLIYTDNGLEFAPTTECYKEWLTWMNKFWEEGLIDPNSMTQADDQRRATASSGDIIGMINGTSAGGVGVWPEAAGDYTPLVPFNHENYGLGVGVQQACMAITDKCENPEVLVAWIDWFYTKEGGLTALAGIQDENWKMNDDGTWEALDTGDKYAATAQYLLSGAAGVPCIWHNYYADKAPITDPTPAQQNSINTAKKYQEGGIYTTGTNLMSFQYTEEEKKEQSTLATDINAYVANYCSQIITGVEDIDATWDTFQSELKKMGVDKLLAIYQAVDARIGK